MGERLAGRRALVTGARRGIGRAIAEAYADEGARVAVLDLDRTDLDAVLDSMATDGVAIECDVRETGAVTAAVDEAVDAFGGLDVVVNNAGVIGREALVDTDDETMERVLDVNLAGTMRVARATIPHLMRSAGTLVNVSSQLSRGAVPGVSVYTASKGGVSSLTRQLAVEHARDGVRVNALAPGIVDTDMTRAARGENPNWEADRLERIPMNRLGEPTDIAGPAVFLASDEAAYVTGHVLVVDGGYLAR
jgi:NAD(P)-dependent dehydrogenase (short-subunit alcohol dehydrogenase family)